MGRATGRLRNDSGHFVILAAALMEALLLLALTATLGFYRASSQAARYRRALQSALEAAARKTALPPGVGRHPTARTVAVAWLRRRLGPEGAAWTLTSFSVMQAGETDPRTHRTFTSSGFSATLSFPVSVAFVHEHLQATEDIEVQSDVPA